MPRRQCLGDTTYFHLAEPGTSRCKAHSWRGNWPTTTPAQRGYGTEWRKLRKAILDRDAKHCLCPGCTACHRVNDRCVRRATDVDHIRPKSQGGTNHPDNLRSLCKLCHQAKTKAQHPRMWS